MLNKHSRMKLMAAAAGSLMLPFFLVIVIIVSIAGASESTSEVSGSYLADPSRIQEELVREMEWYHSNAADSNGAKYLDWIGIPRGSAWCASFASWFLSTKCNIQVRQPNALNMLKTLVAMGAVKHGRDYSPKMGDLVFYSDNGTDSGSGHVGFAMGDGGVGTGHILGGNQSHTLGCRSGRTEDLPRISTRRFYAFCTPNYEASLTAPAAAGKATGSTNEEKAFNFFVSAGYSRESAAGIVGNMGQESGVNPQYDDGLNYGVCSWIGGRKRNCIQYCQQKYGDKYSLAGQCEFVAQEISGIRGLENLRSMKDIKAATELFELKFERAGKPNMPRRIRLAMECYQKYGK